jgi:hypothetical protein
MIGSRFRLLWRTFVAQCFVSDTVDAEDQLRAAIVGVVAFLLVPGLVMLVELSFDYQGIVLRAIRFQQFDHLTDTLEWVMLVFVTYSAVAVGCVGAAIWDVLVFDRRDALVLGPLPVPAAIVALAKAAAIASVMLAAALAVNLFNAIAFAFATADRLGAAALVRHFAAHLTATAGAAVFVFSVLLTVRGVVGAVASARAAAAIGTVVQFVFVLAVLAIVILCPVILRVRHAALVNFTVTHALPTAWFLGVFEWIRGSDRWYVHQLAVRAAIGTGVAIAAAALTSSVAVCRHLRRNAAATTLDGVGGGARLRRAIARRLIGSDGVAAGIADFMLLTLARSRAQRTPLAMNVAVGVALAAAAAVQSDRAALSAPGVVVLWIPLVLAYWTIVGLRASCFVPAEVPAAWVFEMRRRSRRDAQHVAIRAVFTASVLPSIVVVSLLTAIYPLGPAKAVAHAALAAAVVMLLSEIAAWTIPFVPFTRPYQAGRAKLRTRWWLYLVGTYLAAAWPASFEVWAIDHPPALVAATVACIALAFALDYVGRQHWLERREPAADDAADSPGGFTVLDIAVAVQGAPET